MKHSKVQLAGSLRPAHPTTNRREQDRATTDFGLMYSAQTRNDEVLIGDGKVTDLSRQGLGIKGTTPVQAGTELTLFLYLPDGHDPLFILEARVAWSTGRRFGVEITRMDLREQNRFRYFLMANLQHVH